MNRVGLDSSRGCRNHSRGSDPHPEPLPTLTTEVIMAMDTAADITDNNSMIVVV